LFGRWGAGLRGLSENWGNGGRAITLTGGIALFQTCSIDAAHNKERAAMAIPRVLKTRAGRDVQTLSEAKSATAPVCHLNATFTIYDLAQICNSLKQPQLRHLSQYCYARVYVILLKYFDRQCFSRVTSARQNTVNPTSLNFLYFIADNGNSQPIYLWL